MRENISMDFLHPDHLADHEKSGLYESIILEARIESVRPADISKETGVSNQSIASAYRTPYLNMDGNILFYQYKIFPSIVDNEGREIKYIQPKGTPAKPYIPPRIWDVKDKPNKHLWLTEGVKKCLKLIQHGESAMSFSGVWNFKAGKDSMFDEEKDLWSELKKFIWKGRNVYLAFDADLWVNPQVRKALYELSLRLHNEGAIIKIVTWELSGGKGIDDFLVYYESKGEKAEDVLEVLKKDSSSLENFINSDHTDEILRALAVVGLDFLKYEHLISVISKKLKIKEKYLKTEVNKRKELEQTTDENVVIAHPSCEVSAHFLSLGFKETYVLDGKAEDRNMYLVSTNSRYVVVDDGNTSQIETNRYVFDVRDRVLMGINERWSKKKMRDFVNNPTSVALYQKIKNIVRNYIELKNEAYYGLVSAWIIATYFHRCFNAFPFLFFYGKKGSGKSRILDLLEKLCFNAIKVKGITVASLADSLDGLRGTFLCDQAESLSNPQNEELVGILADSYTVGGGRRRLVHISNKNRRVLEFETYSPKAFASFKDIHTDLKDRCVQISMLRAVNDFPYPEAHLPIWHKLRDELYRSLLVNWKQVIEIYQHTGDGVTHRVRELWRPLETILRLEGVPGEEIQEIKSTFLESMQETQAELTDFEHDLFEALLAMLKDIKEGIFTVSEIAKKMESYHSENDKKFTTWVGKSINQLSLFTKNTGRKKKQRSYLFQYDRVQDIFSRYHQTSGLVVNTQQNQGVSMTTEKNSSGNQWSNGNSKGSDIPLNTTDQKSSGHAGSPENQGKYHYTTETTEIDEKKEIPEEIPEVEYVEEILNV